MEICLMYEMRGTNYMVKSFILYSYQGARVNVLDEHQQSVLFRNLFRYVNCDNLLNMDKETYVVFAEFKKQIDCDQEKYKEVCEKGSESANKRWKKKADTPIQTWLNDLQIDALYWRAGSSLNALDSKIKSQGLTKEQNSLYRWLCTETVLRKEFTESISISVLRLADDTYSTPICVSDSLRKLEELNMIKRVVPEFGMRGTITVLPPSKWKNTSNSVNTAYIVERR